MTSSDALYRQALQIVQSIPEPEEENLLIFTPEELELVDPIWQEHYRGEGDTWEACYVTIA